MIIELHYMISNNIGRMVDGCRLHALTETHGFDFFQSHIRGSLSSIGRSEVESILADIGDQILHDLSLQIFQSVNMDGVEIRDLLQFC